MFKKCSILISALFSIVTATQEEGINNIDSLAVFFSEQLQLKLSCNESLDHIECFDINNRKVLDAKFDKTGSGEAFAFANIVEEKPGGIGILFTVRDGLIQVTDVFDSMPAAVAGVKVGDIIRLVNGESTVEFTMQKFFRKIRGDVGSDVAISVERKKSPNLIDFTISRVDVTNGNNPKFHCSSEPVIYQKYLFENGFVIEKIDYDYVSLEDSLYCDDGFFYYPTRSMSEKTYLRNGEIIGFVGYRNDGSIANVVAARDTFVNVKFVSGDSLSVHWNDKRIDLDYMRIKNPDYFFSQEYLKDGLNEELSLESICYNQFMVDGSADDCQENCPCGEKKIEISKEKGKIKEVSVASGERYLFFTVGKNSSKCTQLGWNESDFPNVTVYKGTCLVEPLKWETGFSTINGTELMSKEMTNAVLGYYFNAENYKKITGMFESADGLLKLEYKNGEPTGREYYESGEVKVMYSKNKKSTFSKYGKKISELIGDCESIKGCSYLEFYDNGAISLEYKAKNGYKYGEEKEYYENGALKKVIPRKNHGVNGIVKFFGQYYSYETNETETYLAYECGYKNDEKHGVEKEYYSNKKVRSIVKWKNGETITDKICYDMNGKKEKMGKASIECD